jgi:hypothetical protein
LPFINTTITVIIFKIAPLFRWLICITIYNLLINTKSPTCATLVLTFKPTLVYAAITVIVFAVTLLWITWTAGQVYKIAFIAEYLLSS